MKKKNYSLPKVSIVILLVLVFIVYLYLILTTPNNNFNKIKEYFKQTQNTKSHFIRTSDDGKKDTIVINEHVRLNNTSLHYSVEYLGNLMEIDCTPHTFNVFTDTNAYFIIIKNGNYSRETEDIFKIPEIQQIDGKYLDDCFIDRSHYSDAPKFIGMGYEHRLYFSSDNDDIILHRDFSFKSMSHWLYYFSKKNGLYKIIILLGDTGLIDELYKIIK
jgi:hypothetical protein